MKLWLFGIVLLLMWLPLSAQEALVPLDSAGKVDRISAELDRKLGLFQDRSNFREARLFQISDSAYVLEVEYQPEARLLKERRPLTLDGVIDFRQKVTAQLRAFVPSMGLNQDGRARFIVGTTTLSLLYYGWAVPVALDVSSGTTAVSMYLIIGGAGYFVPYLATQHSTVTDGMAGFSWYGGSRGIANGLLLGYALGGNDPDARGVLAGGVVVSLAEMFSFYGAAAHTNMSAGKAATMGAGGDCGYVFGIGGAQLAGTLDGDHADRAAALILIGHGAGLLAGNLVTNLHPYTKGDARVLESATFLGGGVLAATANVLGNTDDNVYAVTAMLGTAAGFGLGHVLTRNTGFTEGQGSLIALGELGGALTGTGIAYIITGGHGNERPFTGLAALGGTAGFWLAYKAFAPHAHKTTSWNLQVSPQTLTSLTSRGTIAPVPALGARIRF